MAENTSRTDEFGRTVYGTTCTECGQQTEVPFQPAEGRPVFCRDCFRKKRQTNPRRDDR